jgi:hypothetical protein
MCYQENKIVPWVLGRDWVCGVGEEAERAIDALLSKLERVCVIT